MPPTCRPGTAQRSWRWRRCGHPTSKPAGRRSAAAAGRPGGPGRGEPVTIRYDPRDLGEIRVFHRNRFLCRAISREHAGQALTLKDIQAARTAHRRALRGQLDERRAAVSEYLPAHPADPQPSAPSKRQDEPEQQRTAQPKPRLHTYLEDKA